MEGTRLSSHTLRMLLSQLWRVYQPFPRTWGLMRSLVALSALGFIRTVNCRRVATAIVMQQTMSVLHLVLVTVACFEVTARLVSALRKHAGIAHNSTQILVGRG